jgi:hypothetical protein
MSAVYNSGRYAPSCIFNMDESGFKLALPRRQRKIAPRDHPHNGQSLPGGPQHVTVVACIGVTSAPVPPLLIYPGKHVQTAWTAVKHPEPRQITTTSHSGWTNGYIHKKWLETVFEPYTRQFGRNRLLILDGHDSHIKVDFLEACWARGIACLILPAHLSGVLQPLDVNFFNPLKAAQNAIQEKEIKGLQAAQDLSRATRSLRKRQSYPKGEFFDPMYQETHAVQLAERKSVEEEARRKRRRKDGQPERVHASEFVRQCTAGPSRRSASPDPLALPIF